MNACTLGGVELIRCGLANTITAGAAATYHFNACFSEIAGSSSPTFDFGAAVGNTSLNMRHYSGGITIEAMGDTGTDTMSLEGNGAITEGTCTGGAVSLRGNFKQNSITNLTITADDNTTNIAAIPTTAMRGTDNAATAVALATVDAIADQLNLGIIYGAAAAGTLSTTEATTDLTGYTDDQLIGRTIIWTSGVCDGEGSSITDYAELNGHLTFVLMTLAPGAADTFKIV